MVVIETNLVQRTSKSLGKKKSKKTKKTKWSAQKRQNFKMCKMSLEGNDNI